MTTEDKKQPEAKSQAAVSDDQRADGEHEQAQQAQNDGAKTPAANKQWQKKNSTGRQKERGRASAFGKSRKGRVNRNERQKSDFETRVLSARRVSRVVAGGRRFSLSVAVAAGNRKGKVGIGAGKGFDMATAMEKAQNQAKKNLVDVRITDEKGIPSDAIGKCCASVVHIRPSKGFVAGGAVRIIAELAGIEHINAKIQTRSKCHLNNARATLQAFEKMKG